MNLNLNFNFLQKKLPLAAQILVIGLLALLARTTVIAEPYLSLQTKLQCSVCHVNPTGGGMRTEFGRVYGNRQLPASSENLSSADIAKLSEFFSIGANLRYGLVSQSSANVSARENTFAVESAQFYMLINTGLNGLSLYLDQQVAPGSAINREAFILKRFDDGNYLKVGKMMPALGLKLEDDSAFTRRFSGFNFDNSDNGIEYGIQSSNAVHTLFVTNGTNAVSNDDNKFQLGGRSEFSIDSYRLGAALVKNNSDNIDKTIYAIFGGYVFEELTMLAEITQVSNQVVNDSALDFKQRIALIEANWQFSRGHNLKVSEEYYDPDTGLKEDHWVRHSIVYEYVPYPYLQLRFGVRQQNVPPQLPANETDTLFIQSHFYF